MGIENNDNCFVCGMKNPYGFQVKPEIKNGGEFVYIGCTPPEHLQGWANILHGGILSTLLDEAITHVGIGDFRSTRSNSAARNPFSQSGTDPCENSM